MISKNAWKYGLSLDLLDIETFSDILDKKTLDKYILFVECCHCAVESYLDSHPQIKFRSPDFGYFDILKKAAPNWYDEIDIWNKKIADCKEKYQENMFNYMQSLSVHPINKENEFVKKMCHF